MTFSEKLVIIRKKYGLTQDDLAKQLGVSRQSVYKWECGQSYPEVPKLLELKLHFNISLDELLDDTYEMPLPEKKKRKRLSKEAMKKIEESVEAGDLGSIVANREVTRIIEEAMSAAEEEHSAPAVAEPEAEEVEETKEEAVEEPVAVAAAVAEPAVEKAEEPAPAPEVKAEEPVAETAPEASAKPEKKVGFFGKLFGKK